MLEGRVEAPHGEARAWQRAAEHLARRRSYAAARFGLLLVATLAVYAPFLASDRPLYLEAVRHGEFERARAELVPVSAALAELLARSEDEFLAARPAGASQDLQGARAAERDALGARLARLRASLGVEERSALDALRRELEAAMGAASAGRRAEAARAGEALARRARELAEALAPPRVTLVATRSSPLLAGLEPLEAGLAAGWVFVLAWRPLVRRHGAARVLLLGTLTALAVALLWNALVGGGPAFPTAPYKEQLTRGELRARRVLFAPVPYGFAEQHAEESLRPPTWLAESELDERGAYVRGPRAPRPDPVTGFVPASRPVDVRAGEPALNAPWRHLLGTDATGRDLLARSIHGARVSLGVGCLATAILMVIGVAIGALAGYFGGRLDLLLSRLIEVVVSFPLLFLVLVLVAFVGPSVWNVILVLGCLGWTGVARLARAEFLRQRELDYVAAARSLGFSWPRIVVRHVLPNALPPLLVAATFSVAGAIVIEATLSFLGYGVRVPIPSWGALTGESRDPSSWWLQLFPGAFLFATVLCVQLLGDALRDALDPRLAGPSRGAGPVRAVTRGAGP
jgi:peptide/nickel transport system permease protein